MGGMISAIFPTRAREKWAKSATAERVLEDLTKVFLLGGHDSGNVSSALEDEELVNFNKIFRSISIATPASGGGSGRDGRGGQLVVDVRTNLLVCTQSTLIAFLSTISALPISLLTDAGIYDIICALSIFPFPRTALPASYFHPTTNPRSTTTPLSPSPSPTNALLTSPALLRAILLLLGRDYSLLGRAATSYSVATGHRVVQRARGFSHLSQLLFRALAASSGGIAGFSSSTVDEDDVIDVLVALQPVSSACIALIPRDDWRPMAKRLLSGPPSGSGGSGGGGAEMLRLEDLRVGRRRFDAFMRLCHPPKQPNQHQQHQFGDKTIEAAMGGHGGEFDGGDRAEMEWADFEKGFGLDAYANLQDLFITFLQA